MKRTLLSSLPYPLPEELARLCKGARIFDSSCSQEAKTYFIDKDGGYYLKLAPPGQLKIEGEMGRYFHRLKLAPEVLLCDSLEDGTDLLLTRRAEGEDATHADCLREPERLAALLGETLRSLHETAAPDCPVANRNEGYFAFAEENYRKGIFDSSHLLGEPSFSSADQAIAAVREGTAAFRCEVLLHGDYCLPNVMLKNWRFSAFIDLGNGGVGDRHIDLFWGLWSLTFNLKTSRYGERFLDAYGRDQLDRDRLRTVRAAECFG